MICIKVQHNQPFIWYQLTRFEAMLLGQYDARFSITGKNVKGWVANDPTQYDAESYETIICHACGRVHLVNPKTGKVICEEQDQ